MLLTIFNLILVCQRHADIVKQMLNFELLNVKQPDFKNMLKFSVYVDLSPPAHISQILRLFLLLL